VRNDAKISKKKPKGDWAANEAAGYIKQCVF
jgi:hypothetical protein